MTPQCPDNSLPVADSTVDTAADSSTAAPASPDEIVGRSVRKHFPGHGWFIGKITGTKRGGSIVKVQYNDGDEEELDFEEAVLLLVPQGKTSGGVARRPRILFFLFPQDELFPKTKFVGFSFSHRRRASGHRRWGDRAERVWISTTYSFGGPFSLNSSTLLVPCMDDSTFLGHIPKSSPKWSRKRSPKAVLSIYQMKSKSSPKWSRK